MPEALPARPAYPAQERSGPAPSRTSPTGPSAASCEAVALTASGPRSYCRCRWKAVRLLGHALEHLCGAGIDIFTLARRMGTSVAMIDRTYGHLAAGADDYERDLLHAYDRRSNSNGRRVGAGSERPGGESG
jgi:hypothetical protein